MQRLTLGLVWRALTLLLTPAKWRREPLRKWCDCGRQVWDVETRAQLSSFEARIVCWGCGKDHSRVPTLAWLVRFYRKRLLKRRRAYGIFKMWRFHYPVYFWRFRGEEGKIARASRLAGNPTVFQTTE